MTRYIFFLLFLFFSVQHYYGQNLNTYKYVVVPQEFEFQKDPGQYELNELTKFLLEKYGFEAFVEGGEFPEEEKIDRCEILRANVKNDSGLFVTKVQFELRDCNNNKVFISETGRSRLKDFQMAFHEALRDAFESLEDENYNFSGGENTVEVTAIPPKQDTLEGEVVRKAPEEISEIEEPATEVEIVGEEARDENLVFVKKNSVYYLEETSRGYNFYQKGMAEPFAALIKTSGRDSYLYSSVNNKGMAGFDEEGNLVVEILDSETDELTTVIYTRQSQ